MTEKLPEQASVAPSDASLIGTDTSLLIVDDDAPARHAKARL
jgi:two-component system response regulator RegA